jgi:AcrR family transcriptional regulator
MVQKKTRGRPKKDERSREADRRALVAAAVEIVREGGASALSARAVAERAGTAVGSVYSLFASLEELRLEANALTMRDLRASLVAALEGGGGGPTTDRLLRLADAYQLFAASHRHAWAAMFEPRTIEAPPAIAADIAALFGVIEGVIRADGTLDEAEIPVMAKALWSSVHGMIYLGHLGGLGPIGPSDVRPMVDALVRSTVQGWASPRRRAPP